jgi:hypothetical protein
LAVLATTFDYLHGGGHVLANPGQALVLLDILVLSKLLVDFLQLCAGLGESLLRSHWFRDADPHDIPLCRIGNIGRNVSCPNQFIDSVHPANVVGTTFLGLVKFLVLSDL